jgi:hypothetical protein
LISARNGALKVKAAETNSPNELPVHAFNGDETVQMNARAW